MQKFLRLGEAFFIVSCITFFCLMVYLYGINDVEDYELGFFSAKLLTNNIFVFFYDFYGPGTKIPLGTGPFLHPANFLIFNTKQFYFLYIFFNLSIQIIFVKKIFKILKIKYIKYLIPFLIIFAVPNLNYTLSDDWLSAFHGYCVMPLVFYYFLKIIHKEDKLNLFKFSLSFCFWLINGHIGLISVYLTFFILYFILSINNFEFKKKIFNISFIVCLTLVALFLLDNLYFMHSEMSEGDGIRYIKAPYSKRPYVEIFYPFDQFLTWTKLNRLPGNPILIYFCLIVSCFNIFTHSKKIIKNIRFGTLKKKFKNYFISIDNVTLFSFVYLIFFISSITKLLEITYVISAHWISRDVILFCGLFIYASKYKNLRFNIKIILNFFLIFYTILFLFSNLYPIIKSNQNNFINTTKENSQLTKALKDLGIKKNDYQRIYTSPGLYPYINRGYDKDGIYAQIDLINFNLAPFNGYFKGVNMNGLVKNKYIMHTFLLPDFKRINDNFFLDYFKINYVMITKKELDNLNNENLKFIDTVQTNKLIRYNEIKTLINKNVEIEDLIVDKINSPNNLFIKKHHTDLIDKSILGKEQIIIYKRNTKNLSINEKNLKKLKLAIDQCAKLIIDCFIDNKDLFSESDHKLIRIKNGKFIIENIKNKKYILLPFLYDKNWSTDKGSIITLKDFSMIIHNKNNLNKITIEYFDNIRFNLRVISLVSIFILITMVIILSYKKIKKNIF